MADFGPPHLHPANYARSRLASHPIARGEPNDKCPVAGRRILASASRGAAPSQPTTGRARDGDWVMKRQLHLNLFIHGRGHHEASWWRHPASSPLQLTTSRYYQDLAQRAEAAKFDSIFFADQLAPGWRRGASAAHLAGADHRAGGPRRGDDARGADRALLRQPTPSPSTLARQFASIDHISNGRAAWNIVTTWRATAAENFGGTGK